jgi:serine/threonine protein kinase
VTRTDEVAYHLTPVTAPHRFGPFFLDARIAVGGTAEVYLARPASPLDGLPNRLVVKRLLPHFVADPEGRTMFEREARLHAAVTHENVVTVFHAGSDERGEPYLAMEYIDGVDGFRLLRRLRQEGEFLPVGVAVYIAREVLRGLESVHAALAPNGTSLGIVHRDVSPSNIYFSHHGNVKIGDFGIARSTTRATLRSEAGQVLKGKFAYLAPEQVAGDVSDHRADLFSLGSVLAEMLLNRPLFPGGGQLAILLAIRDCNLDALNEIKPRLPPGLFEVMERALARDPADRYPDATAFAEALAPFEADTRLAARELSVRVRWVKTVPSTDKLRAQRPDLQEAAPRSGPGSAPGSAPSSVVAPSSGQRATVAEPEPATRPAPILDLTPFDPEEDDDDDAKTSEYALAPSFVLKLDGTSQGPWSFARLMEALATGQIDRGDRIDFVGRGFRLAEDIEELERFFAASSAATSEVDGPGAPDLNDALSPRALLDVLAYVLRRRETGVLFVEREASPDDHGVSAGRGDRKELYFVEGKLKHVASSNASELLGEYLVRRGVIQRDELDLALAVLPRYSGRMGDTLIAMGLVGPVDIFRAIREQGRDRVADLFLWRSGRMSFYRGQTAPHVEFPLDLELAALMLAGIETAKPGDMLLPESRADLDRTLVSAKPREDGTYDDVTWPPSVARVIEMTREPTTLRDVLQSVAKQGALTSGDVIRATDILMAAGLLAFA